MEPWPLMAWGLMLISITGWIKAVKSRDFTEKDIIFLHPSTTPYPGGFKCFTCEEAADNYECNRWAPDLYCSQESKYCSSHHKMSWDGNTVSVSKYCVSLDDCLQTGCTEIDDEGNRVCTACCEGNICNMALPQNETDAIFATTSPINTSIRPAQPLTLLLFSPFISLVLYRPN